MPKIQGKQMPLPPPDAHARTLIPTVANYSFIYLQQCYSQSVSQSISQSISQSVSQSVNQSVNQSVSQSVCLSHSIHVYQEQCVAAIAAVSLRLAIFRNIY